jgi:hypothetical protein
VYAYIERETTASSRTPEATVEPEIPASRASSTTGTDTSDPEPEPGSNSVQVQDADWNDYAAGTAHDLEVASPSKALQTRPRVGPPKSVSFCQLTVNSHPLILGDNPSATSGPPLTIGWDALESVTIMVEAYELGRPGPPRRHTELQVPGDLRRAWLRREGFTEVEMATAERECRIVQRRRIACAAAAAEGHGLRTNVARHHPSCSPFNPCGNLNQLLKQGMAKLLTSRWTKGGRGEGSG